MNHILTAAERLLGAIEHRAYQLRLARYHRRTGGVPPKVRRIGNEVLQAAPAAKGPGPKAPPLILAHAGYEACQGIEAARNQELDDLAASVRAFAASVRSLQAGDAP